MVTPDEKDSRPLFTRAFGLRIALWYATLFIAGSMVVVFLTYVLTATSLAQRDRQLLNAKLGDYAAAYRRGGLNQLADTVRAEQRTAPERLFVRVVDRGREAVVLSNPEGWDPEQLETASLRLVDGTLVQVGKSTEAREDLLARFRALPDLYQRAVDQPQRRGFELLRIPPFWIAQDDRFPPAIDHAHE